MNVDRIISKVIKKLSFSSTIPKASIWGIYYLGSYKGRIEARSEDEALSKLRAKGYDMRHTVVRREG